MFEITITRTYGRRTTHCIDTTPNGLVPRNFLVDVSSCLAFPQLEQVIGIDIKGETDDIREAGLVLGRYMAGMYCETPSTIDYDFQVSDNLNLLIGYISGVMNSIWSEREEV